MDKFCEYKNLKIEQTPIKETTAEEIDEEIASILNSEKRYTKKEGPAQNGDIVNLDFKGVLDGTPFPGGTAEKYDLELGSGTFIPGFEEQLIGANCGDDIDVSVTFPEQYHAVDLKGKAVVFHCHINEVKNIKEAQLDDELFNKYHCASQEEFYAAVKKYLDDKKERESLSEFTEKICAYLVEHSEIEVSEDEVEHLTQSTIKQYEDEMAKNGLDLVSQLKMLGSSLESFTERVRNDARYNIKVNRFLDYIAINENLTLSEEEFQSGLNLLKEKYYFDDESFEAFKVDQSEAIRSELKRYKVFNYLIEVNK